KRDLLIGLGLVHQSRHRGFDRGQRRAKVVRDGVEQRRLQPLALLEDFRLSRAFGGASIFIIQTFDLASARFGLLGAPFGPRRQLARGQRGDQERRQRHPVLRIVDGKSIYRLEEEEVETDNAQQRTEGGRAAAPTRRPQQTYQQPRQSHR